MDQHFIEAARALKAGSRYVFVVGNSQTRSDVVPVHEALVQLAATAGFELERAFGYRIRRHYMKFPRRGRGGIILIDWVLVLRKQASANQARTPPLRWVTLAPNTVADWHRDRAQRDSSQSTNSSVQRSDGLPWRIMPKPCPPRAKTWSSTDVPPPTSRGGHLRRSCAAGHRRRRR